MSTNTSRTPDDTDQDVPVEIIGYITDPKLVGYQILTNYESTYWRSLVGRDAWALYEVLRSFCHEGNDTCHPSIKLLMKILGITDRRQLTGRVTTTRGKERVLPGFIDILQDYKLAVAEMKGEGPTLRYIFHLNLTPPPLSPKQLEQLPQRLQRKHAQLLKRVAQDVQKLDNIERKKPKKGQKEDSDHVDTQQQAGSDDFSGSSNIFPEGGGTAPVPPGTVPSPPGTAPVPPGTVPSKQHPYNSTQKTTVVVEKLEKKGVNSETIQELLTNHSPEYILEKISFLEWKLMLQENDKQRRGRPISDPAGWLVRAVEKDFQPPEAFYEYRKYAEDGMQETKMEEEQQTLEFDWPEQDGPLAQLMEEYGTSQSDTDLWKQVLGELKLQMPKSTFDTWLSATHLLALDEGGKAVVSVSNDMAKDWLEHRLADKVNRTLASLSEHEDIELEFVVLRGDHQTEPGEEE